MQDIEYIACPECDLLHRRQALLPNTEAVCSRCGAVLYSRQRNSLDRTLALVVGGIIMFCIANFYPFLTLNIEGQKHQMELITGIVALYHQGMWLVAILVLTTGIFFPVAELVGLAYILTSLRFGVTPWRAATLFRMIRALQPWVMVEVFLLGVLVAIVKLSDSGSITPGVALYAFMALSFVLAAAAASLNPDVVWERLTEDT